MKNQNETEENTEGTTENETKSEKFVRLAEGRMTKVRVALARIDNLANRSAYEYTEEQVNQMFDILEKELTDVKSSFLKTEKEEKIFSFQK